MIAVTASGSNPGTSLDLLYVLVILGTSVFSAGLAYFAFRLSRRSDKEAENERIEANRKAQQRMEEAVWGFDQGGTHVNGMVDNLRGMRSEFHEFKDIRFVQFERQNSADHARVQSHIARIAEHVGLKLD